MKRLIIFAGAGASRGISGEKYPMALDFRKRLSKEVTDSELYRRLSNWLTSHQGIESFDIEHILWELGKLRDSLDSISNGESFASQLISTNQIQSIAKIPNLHWPNFHGGIRNVQTICHQIQNKINENVYNFYSQQPSKDELGRSWTPLLEYILKINPSRIDIVTTNYDLVIEYAIEFSGIGVINTGHRQGLNPGIDLGLWRENDSTSGMLTKLHGSVDWKLGNGGTEEDPIIRRGHPDFDGDHSKRLILYPGFKGSPSREPFIAFHEYFRRQIQEATHMLFIGFAFRDEHINNIISSSISSHAKIAIVDPTKRIPKLSFLSSAQHLQKGFGLPEITTLIGSDGIDPFLPSQLDEWAS